MPLAVGVIGQHPAGSPPAAERVTVVPDEHRHQADVEFDVGQVEIILEQAAAEGRRNDDPDRGKFLVAEMAYLNARVDNEQTLASSGPPRRPGCGALFVTRSALPTDRVVNYAEGTAALSSPAATKGGKPCHCPSAIPL